MAFRNPLSFASVVQANSFELLDQDGTVVAELSADTGPPPTQGLDFHHLEAHIQDSRLSWTIEQNGIENVTLRGPARNGSPEPYVQVACYSPLPGVQEQTSITLHASTVNGGIARMDVGSNNSIPNASGAQIQADYVQLQPNVRTILNGRTARLLVDSSLEFINSNTAFGAGTYQPVGITATPLALKVDDVLIVTATVNINNTTFAGISDCYAQLEFVLNATPLGIGGFGIHTNPVTAFHARSVTLVARHVVTVAGNYRVRVVAVNFNSAVNNTACENISFRLEAFGTR